MKLSLHIIVLTLLGLTSLPSLVQAAPDGKTLVMQGNKNGAVACMACHGANSEGNPGAGYPYLAGLPSSYILNQLKGFRSGTRQNPIMKPIASALSDQEMVAVAKYLSRLKLPAVARHTLAKGTDGESLAMQGKWQDSIPACFQCHGDRGQGIADHFPPLVGQPYSYIKNQLMDWQAGKRSNDPLGLMQSVAAALNKQEIESVARYLSNPSTH